MSMHSTRGAEQLPGWEILTVRDLMEERFIAFGPDMTIEQAVQEIVSKGGPGGPVVDRDGRLVGFFSERDCLALAMTNRYHNMPAGHVYQHMCKKVRALDIDMSIFEVIDRFMNYEYRLYPVLDRGRVVGVVSRFSVLEKVDQFSQTTW